MIKKIKTLLLSLSIALGSFAPLAVPAMVHAQNVDEGLCAGASFDVTKSETCTDDGTATTRINTIIKLIINIFSLVVGVISVIMIIIGGLKYITSGGDSGNVTGAKNTILYAVIGLVVVALAQFIVRFVLAKVSGAGEGE